MALPSRVEIITEENRAENNRYLIPGRSGQVFPVSIPAGCFVIVTVGDTYLMDRQDFGMLFWFGTEPWKFADIPISLVHDSLNLRKQPADFVIYEKGTQPPTEFDNNRTKTFIPYPADTTFYCNIHNLVNSENSYELIFLLEQNQ